MKKNLKIFYSKIFPFAVVNIFLDLIGIGSIIFLLGGFLGIFTNNSNAFHFLEKFSFNAIAYFLICVLSIKLLINNLTANFLAKHPLIYSKKNFLIKFQEAINFSIDLSNIKDLNRELIEIYVNICNSLMIIYAELTFLAIALVFLFMNLPTIVIVALTMISLILYFTNKILKKHLNKISTNYLISNKLRFNFIDECSKSYEEIFFYRLSYVISNRLEILWNRTINIYKNFLYIKHAYKYFVEYFFSLTIILLFIFFKNQLKSSLDIQLIMVATFLIRVLPSLTRLQPALANFSYYKNSLDKINSDSIIKKKKVSTYLFGDDAIRLKSCDYIAEKKYILKNINYTFKRNKSYLITGESGSGKSSLVNIVLGLTYTNKGNVSYNKELINDSILNCSYIGQHPMIFDDSVINNITLFRKFDRKKLSTVLKISGINFNLRLKAKNLSGGEKKRIAIARALLIESPIYIFDEVDSGLDISSSNKLFKEIFRFLPKKLLIVISHKKLNGFSHVIDIKNQKLNYD